MNIILALPFSFPSFARRKQKRNPFRLAFRVEKKTETETETETEQCEPGFISHLVLAFRIIKNKIEIPMEDLFDYRPSVGTRAHSLSLVEPRFRVNVVKHCFRNRVTRAWNRLPEDAVNASSVDQFKAVLSTTNYML